MDIGIGHLIKVNGELVNAYWDTFNPNLALGDIHEIAIFDHDIELKDIFSQLDECLVREEFVSSFQLASRRDSIETYLAKYQVSLRTSEPGVKVKNFVFLSDGRPWAICRIAEHVELKPYLDTIFAFESSIIVNNKLDIAANPWSVEVDKFKIQYGAMVSAIDNEDGIVLASRSLDLEEVPSNDMIVKTINKDSEEIFPEFVFENGKIGITLEPTTDNDLKDIKVIFIRILWNMGILIFVKSVEWEGNKLQNLTLVKGHKLQLMFGIRFKEIKNANTI